MAYDTQQVCLNGHQITDVYERYSEERKAHCTECGAKTIYACPNCHNKITGRYISSGFIGISKTAIPSHCSNCGEKFPWEKEKIKSTNEVETDYLKNIERICSKFHIIAKQLRQRHASRNTIEINDEYDVQDLFHGLLKLFFDDIRVEEWSPSYAGGASRVDFLLKDFQTIIEIKKTRATLKAKELGEQLIVDIIKYQAHPDCKKLICFVYDPEGYISNPRGIENDLNKKDDRLEVKVIIIPKGH